MHEMEKILPTMHGGQGLGQDFQPESSCRVDHPRVSLSSLLYYMRLPLVTEPAVKSLEKGTLLDLSGQGGEQK